MPLLEFYVDLSGMRRKLSVLVDNARDLNAPLKAFGKSYLRHKIQQHFDEEGPGWPQRSPETLKRLANTGGVLRGATAERAQGLMRRKLQRELRRAKKNRNRFDDPMVLAREQAKQNKRAAEGKRSLSMAEVIRRKNAAVERRKRVLEIFEAIASGADVSGPGIEKLVGKLNERMGRARARVSGPLLGKIASSFKLTVENGTLVYGSTIPWSGAHNEGATVGNGADLKARPFAYLTEQDLDVLVDMLIAHLGRFVSVE